VQKRPRNENHPTVAGHSVRKPYLSAANALHKPSTVLKTGISVDRAFPITKPTCRFSTPKHVAPPIPPHWEHFGYMGIVESSMELEMKQMLGLSVALLLLGTGIWANVSGSSLSQYKGAWASHAGR
jgi:hypothetical protein